MGNNCKKDPIRRGNAVLAAALFVFFFAHAGLAAAKICGVELGESLKWTIWAGIAVILAHIAMSIKTTCTMFNDTERPASPKKRQHQYLKWITGGVLLLTVAFHFPQGEGASLAYTLSLIVAAAALAWHSWTGVKSLTRDLDLPSGLRAIIRVVACLAVAAIAVALLV